MPKLSNAKKQKRFREKRKKELAELRLAKETIQEIKAFLDKPRSKKENQ